MEADRVSCAASRPEGFTSLGDELDAGIVESAIVLTAEDAEVYVEWTQTVAEVRTSKLFLDKIFFFFFPFTYTLFFSCSCFQLISLSGIASL